MEKWWNNFANPMLKRAALLLGLWVFSAWGEVYTVEAGSSSVIDLSGIEQCSDNYMFSFKMTGAGYYAIVVKENDSPIDFSNGWNLTNSESNWSSTSPSYQAIIINGGAHDDNNISYVSFNPSTKELAALNAAPDCMPPRIINRYPTIGSTAVSSTNSFLNIGFNQDVSKNAGKIHIKKYSDNSTVASIDVNDAAVEFKYKPVLTSFEEEIFFSTHAGAANMQLEPLMVMDGAQSLLVNATANGTVVVKEMSSGVNWSSYDSLVMWVYPLQNNSIELTTLTNEWDWKTHDVGVLNSNAWNRIALYIPDRNRKEAFYGYGIKSDTGSYYVDHVHLVKSSSKDLLVPINTTLDPNTKYYVNFDQGIVKNGGPTSNNALTTKDWHFTTVNPSYFWDTDAAAGIQAGSGTWGSDNYWSIDGTNLTAWPGDGNKAIFAGDHGAAGAYTITVNGTQKPHKIFFFSTGYALTGGELELTGDDPEIQANAAASINSKIKSVYTKTGASTLSVGSYQTGSLVAISSGTLNITGTSGAANFGPDVSIANNATLTQNDDNLFFGRNTINLNGNNATWNLAGHADQVAWIAGNGKITNNNSALIINLESGVTKEFAGNISGTGSLQISGENATTDPSTWHIKSAQSYTGATYIAGGSKAINNAKAYLQLGAGTNLVPSVLHFGDATKSDLTGKLILGDNSGPSHQTFTELNVHGNSGTFAIVGGNATASTLTLNPSADLVLNGLLGGLGTNENRLALVKSGAHILTLDGTNLYNGATTVSSGELKVLGSVSNSAVTVASGATLSGTGTTGAVTLQSGAKLQPGDNGAGTLYTGDFDLQNGAELHFDLGTSSDLVEVAGNLTLNGKLVIDAGAGYQAGKYQIFTYTGSLINNLTVDPLPHGFSAKIESSGNQVFLVVYGDHYWDLSAAAGFQTGAGTWGVDNYWSTDGITLRNWPGSPSVAVFAGANDDPSVITINETQTAQGIKFTTGGFKLQSGTLSLDAGGFIYGAGSKTLTIESAINSSGGITLQREGGGDNKYTVEFLNSANTINGPLTLRPKTRVNYTTITDGGLVSSLGKGDSGGENIILDGADLCFVGTSDQSSNRLFTLTENGGALLSTSANNAGRLNFTNPGAIGLTGVGARTLELGGNPVLTNILAASLSNPASGTSALAKSGAAIWALTGDHTYTGGTVISAGALQIGNGGTTGSITGDVLNNASLAFNRSDDLNFTGDISGTGTLTKLGAGTLTLSGASTYTGATTISAGTLQLNGSLGNTALSMGHNTTLSGTGELAGNVTVGNNVTIAPGENNAGTLTVGELTLEPTSVLELDIGTASDKITVTGDLTLRGSIHIVAGTGFKAGLYPIINSSGVLTNHSPSLTGLPANYEAKLITAGSDVFLQVTKTITIGGSFTAESKVYDGNTTANFATNNLTLVGVDDDHDVSLAPVFEFAQSNVGVGIAVTLANSTSLIGDEAEFYKISFTGAPTSSADITAKVVTITPAAGQQKIYGAADPTLNFTNSEWGDNNNIGGNLSRAIGEDAGNYAFSIANLTIGPNYSLTLVADPATFAIVKKDLQVTVNDASISFGDAIPAFTVSYSGWANGEDANVLDNTGFALSTTYAQGDNVGTYPINIALGTATDNNYNFTPLTAGTLTVTAKAITITADDQSKTYGTALNLGTTAFTISPALYQAGDITAVALSSAGAAATANVNTYAITPSAALGPQVANYAITYSNGTLTVSKIDLQVTVNDATINYGDAIPAFTVSYSGWVNDDGAGDLDNTGFSLNSTYSPGDNVGTYPINIALGTATDNNYNFTPLTPGTLTITEKAIVVRANNISKVVEAPDPMLTYEVEGSLFGGDNFSGSLTRAAGEAPGTYAIGQGSLQLSPNYIIDFHGATFTIANEMITITINSQSKLYGDNLALGTMGAGWYVSAGNYTAGDITTVELASPGAIGTAAVGTYALTGNNADGPGVSNYAITYINDFLTVDPRPITVTAQNSGKYTGTADPILNYAITSGALYNGDVFAGSLSRDPGEAVNTYAINQGTLDAGDNYDLTFVGADFVIQNKTITIGGSFMVEHKTYDATTNATMDDNQLVLVGVDPTHTVGLSSISAFAQSNVADNILVTLQPSTVLTGADADKYILDLSGAPTTLANIIPAVIEISPAGGQSKVYGNADPIFSYTHSPLVDATPITGALGRAAGDNYGTYPFNLGDLDAGANYTFQMMVAPPTFAILKKDLTVSADDKSVIYGAALPPLTLSYSGFVTGESAANLANTDFALSTTYHTGSSVGTYPIYLALGDASAQNYNLVLQDGILSVGQIDLTISADAQSKVYGQGDPALSYQVSGTVLPGDNFTGALARTAGENVGIYPINQGNLALNSNYNITFQGADLEITAQNLTLSATPQSKLYGDHLSLGTTGWEVSSGNPIAGDITAVTLASLGADSSAPVGNYPLSISLAQGPGIANYTITYTPGTLQVNPRPLTITAADTSKTIGDADPTLTYQITAGRLYNGDALTGNIARTPGESEGPYPINLGDLTLSSNYELSFVPGIFTINPPWLHPIMDYANTKILVYGRNSYQSQNFDAKATYTVVAGHKILVQIPWENPNQDSVQWTSNIPEATVKLTPSRATWTVPFTDSATTVAQFKVSNTRGVGDSIKLQIRTKLASAPTYTIGTVRAYDDAKQTVSMRYFARDTLRLTNAQRLKFSMDFRSSIDQQSVNLNWVQNSPGLNANLWSNHLDLEWHLYEKTNTFSFVVCDEYSLSDTITLTVILQEKPTLTLNPPPLNPYLVFLGGSQQAQGFTLPQAEVVKIRIFDLQGRTWHSQHRILASGSYLFTDFLHTAPQNLYISIESHTFNWTGPLRKQL